MQQVAQSLGAVADSDVVFEVKPPVLPEGQSIDPEPLPESSRIFQMLIATGSCGGQLKKWWAETAWLALFEHSLSRGNSVHARAYLDQLIALQQPERSPSGVRVTFERRFSRYFSPKYLHSFSRSWRGPSVRIWNSCWCD